MAHLIRLFLFPFFLCFSTLITRHASAAGNTSTEFIQDTCKKTHFSELCVATLTAAPESAKADLKSLCRFSLQHVTRNGTNTSKYLSELLDTTVDPSLQQCLSDCSESYMDAVEQLDDSIAALDSNAYGDVKTWVAAAMSDAESCEDGCKKLPSHQDVMTQRNTDFSKLCGNVLAITNLLTV